MASATAVTTVGAAVGVASGNDGAANDLEVVAADASLLVEIPAAGNAQLHTASLTQQAEKQSHAAENATRKAAEEAARVAAAEQAAAKKAAAEKAAAEKAAKEKAEREAREAQQAASRAASRSAAPVQSSYTVAEVQAIARDIVGSGQYQCFSNIVQRESSWNYTATNPTSGAYGLVQAYPAAKMESAGSDWRTNPATQIKWGLNYMNQRYGSPCGAWEFWQANHWY